MAHVALPRLRSRTIGQRGRVISYEPFFAAAVDRLREEQRYRVFVDLERIAGRFPYAIWRSSSGPREVVIWCSNDYLAMGQHPKVVGAMVAAAGAFRLAHDGASDWSTGATPNLPL